MSLGLLILDGTTYVRPDRQLRRATKPRVLLASFGDGYEQRGADGINSLAEEYNISFINRTKAEIDDIIAFFDAKKGVTSFSFIIPDTNSGGSEKTIKVVAYEYQQSYTFDDYYGATATFRRVYE